MEDEIAKWIDENTFYCSAFRAKISEKSCVTYAVQQHDPCLICPKKPADVPGKRRFHPYKHVKKGDDKMGKFRKLIVCQECGREAPHASRNMCKACYQKLHANPRRAARKIYAAAENPGSGIRQIILRFEVADADLYARILARSRQERRQPDQQIIWILNQSLPEVTS